jgi:NAD(P)-dependent dehydrogenase (short-subunit alcohol dehydrogenase family)
MLAEDANLEDDLGIDSVKMVEIVALIREEFGIGKETRFNRDEVTSIGGIARLLHTLTSTSAQPNPVPDAIGATARTPTKPGAAPETLQPAPRASTMSTGPTFVHPTAAPHRDATRAPATLTDKIVLITGSGRGLGRTLAISLAAAGVTTIVNSFHSRDAGDATCADIIQAGGKAIHVWGSVANEDHVARMFAEVGQRFGRLDALVASASDGFIGPFEELTAAHWDRGFRTNVVGLQQCAVAAANLMVDGGHIVTMSTVTSNRYLRDFTCQGVLKAAVESLTRYLAVELAPRGVRVNCISAGPVYGELLNRFPDAAARIANWTSLTPVRELTDPNEVANLVGFLISGALRGTTGSIITVDGGLSLSIDGDVSAAHTDPIVRLVG